mmetsp:Transcript_70258/g.222820  ORF Transcript_70258/g.222820 Transcript_70258/m.222820 type:complete len:135 (-) Transcript_70258:1296-1700(-)
MAEVHTFMVPADVVFSVAPTDTISFAAEFMLSNRVGSLLVIEKVKGSTFVCGILTKSDLIRAAYVQSLAKDAPVSEIMSKTLLSVPSSTPRDKVAEMMHSQGVHHCIVQGGMGEFMVCAALTAPVPVRSGCRGP